MNARNNDSARIQSIIDLINELNVRVKELGLTQEVMENEHTAHMRTITDGINFCIYQILEEANALDVETKAKYLDMGWSELRGMRNIFAHDYYEIKLSETWDAIDNYIPRLNAMCVELQNGPQ
jgi:uncharacterized protein with HEPN domain